MDRWIAKRLKYPKQYLIAISYCLLLLISTLYTTNTLAADNPTAKLATSNSDTANTTLNSIAFYYGSHIPWDELHAFDSIVIQPSTIITPKLYQQQNSQLLAYVSMSEISPNSSYYQDINPAWVLGKNKMWHTDIINVANQQWQYFFLEKIIDPLWQAGYRGFFFDNLDSYQLISLSKQQQQQQQQALVTLIKAIKYHHPQAKIILNRGFEILPKVHQQINGVAAESLFYGLNSKHQYITIPQQQQQQLLNVLHAIHQRYQLPIIVIDYLPANRRQQARMTADKIKALGFIPWVSDKDLSSVGVGSIEVIPRKILVIYNTNQYANNSVLTQALRLSAFPLEHMGFSPIYKNIHKILPKQILAGRYVGIVVWLSDDKEGAERQQLGPWIIKQINDHIAVVFLDRFGFPIDDQMSQALDIKTDKFNRPAKKLTISHQDKQFVGLETPPLANRYQFTPLIANDAKILLKIDDQNQQPLDAIAITRWGGYALSPYVIRQFPNNQLRWILSPFPFFRQALRLSAFPAPDVTTENGRRLMLVHIDGEGFVNNTEWPNGSHAGEEAEKGILEIYRIPTTVSVIQAELAADGKETDENSDYFETARRIFKMPWVEIASHSYSRPIKWQQLEQEKSGKDLNLQIPGYQFSWGKELRGSADFIDQNLAPKNKRTKMILWSGDSNPSDAGIAAAYQYQLYNMNYSNTVITKNQQSLSNISPLGVWKGNYYHVFAANGDEISYTNYWTGPFYGVEKMIETFELTDRPHRYKPINIHYHFYAASKKSSYQAVKKVYRYALNQSPFHIFASEYAQKVLDWQHLVIASDGKGWLIRNNHSVRELRIPQQMGYPDLIKSKNVIGYAAYNKDYYIHLGPAEQTLLFLQPTPPQLPYVHDANAFVTDFKRNKKGFKFSLKSHANLSFSLANAQSCVLKQQDKVISPASNSDSNGGGTALKKFHLTSKKANGLTLTCSST